MLGGYLLSRLEHEKSNPNYKLMLMIPRYTMGPTGMIPRYKRFQLVGVFKLNMKEYDTNLVLINMNDAKKLFKRNYSVNVQLRLKDSYNASVVKRKLETVYPDWAISTWYENHATIFSAIQTEKRMMTFILSFLILVAAINIGSTLIMVVTDKEADIAILRTLGASPSVIRRIFIIQGTIIGSIGTLLGTGLGVLIAVNVERIIKWFEHLIGHQMMSSEVYYITEIVGRVLESGDYISTNGTRSLI